MIGNRFGGFFGETIMNDKINITKYKLVACKNCRTVNAIFGDDVRVGKNRTLDCRVCGKEMEYLELKGVVFEGENIEDNIMSQFNDKSE